MENGWLICALDPGPPNLLGHKELLFLFFFLLQEGLAASRLLTARFIQPSRMTVLFPILTTRPGWESGPFPKQESEPTSLSSERALRCRMVQLWGQKRRLPWEVRAALQKPAESRSPTESINATYKLRQEGTFHPAS